MTGGGAAALTEEGCLPCRRQCHREVVAKQLEFSPPLVPCLKRSTRQPRTTTKSLQRTGGIVWGKTGRQKVRLQAGKTYHRDWRWEITRCPSVMSTTRQTERPPLNQPRAHRPHLPKEKGACTTRVWQGRIDTGPRKPTQTGRDGLPRSLEIGRQVWN